MSFEERLVRRIAELERRVREMEATGGFSAYKDLQAESKIGLVTGRIPDANQVRFYSPTDEAHDFTSTTLPSGWQWAGSPFVTPTLNVVNGTFLLIQPGANARSFMFRNSLGTPGIFGIQSVADENSYIAWRLDDGTDNNFVEIGLCDVPLGDKRLISRFRTGGGSVTLNIDSLRYQPALFWMIFYVTGTQWNNWYLNGHLYIGLTMSGFSVAGPFSFTPARFGVVVFTTQWWYRHLIDGVS